MGKETMHDLKKFLAPFPASVKKTTIWLREWVWDLCPACNELMYDNYNALVTGFGLSDKAGDAFCSIAIYSEYVNFGFLRGTEITDPEKRLTGKGSLYRYITVKNKEEFPKTYMKKLLKEAYVNALVRMKGDKQTIKGLTMTKSVAAKKRRPQ
jgi:hypothetical protein